VSVVHVLTPFRYDTRVVQTGTASTTAVEILSGVAAGERLALIDMEQAPAGVPASAGEPAAQKLAPAASRSTSGETPLAPR
jgi:hypothetical protein